MRSKSIPGATGPSTTARILTAALLTAASALPAAKLPDIDALGKTEKFRIVVDKVMQPVEGWVTKEWMVREAAEAGFNVFSPRAGFDRLDEVRQVADWCEKYGILHMPWMRGTLTAKMDDPAANGRRMLWENGVEQPLWSPIADPLWDWMTRYIVEYARISREKPALVGVFLDYENYAPGRVANAYSLSYDDATLAMFAKKYGVTLPPGLPLKGRRQWLEDNGLFETFQKFQVAEWRRRCRELRKAVDAVNPKFRFCVYPAPGTPFIREAIYPEWGTDAAPLILADACTYGRPSKFIPQDRALEINRKKLLDNMRIPQEAGIPFIYVGGIDPVVKGADPEFCGKNAVMISAATGGYWIFYEGPKYDKDHKDYWKWFTWANRAIAAGRWKAWKEPRKEPEEWFRDLFSGAAALPNLVPPPLPDTPKTYSPVRLRGEHMLVFPAKKGRPVHITVKFWQVGRYQSAIGWEIRDGQAKLVLRNKAPEGKDAEITFTPATDGLYLAGVSAGACAWSIASADVPVGIVASPDVHFIWADHRVWFRLRPDAKKFHLQCRGSGTETVRVTVYDAAGKAVGEAQTTIAGNSAALTIPVPPDQAGNVWSLQTSKADEGVSEDNTVRFDKSVIPLLALDPEQVFGVKK